MQTRLRIKKICIFFLTVIIVVNLIVMPSVIPASAAVFTTSLLICIAGGLVISQVAANSAAKYNVSPAIAKMWEEFSYWWEGYSREAVLAKRAVENVGFSFYVLFNLPKAIEDVVRGHFFTVNDDLFKHGENGKYEPMVQAICDIANIIEAHGYDVGILDEEVRNIDDNTLRDISAIARAYALALDVTYDAEGNIASVTYVPENFRLTTHTPEGLKAIHPAVNGRVIITCGDGLNWTYHTMPGNYITNDILKEIYDTPSTINNPPFTLVPFFQHGGEIYIFSWNAPSRGHNWVNRLTSGVVIQIPRSHGDGNVSWNMFGFSANSGWWYNDVEFSHFFLHRTEVVNSIGVSVSDGFAYSRINSRTGQIFAPWHFPDTVIKVSNGQLYPWRDIDLDPPIELIRSVLPPSEQDLTDVLRRPIQSTTAEPAQEEQLVLVPPIPPHPLERLIDEGRGRGLLSENPTITFDRDGIREIDGKCVQGLSDTLGIPLTGNPPVVIVPPVIPGLDLPTLPGITEVFPFSIPFDLYRLVHVFSADPKAPVFTIPLKMKTSSGSVSAEIDESITIDLSEYDHIAEMVRWIIYVVFIVFLAIKTNSLIGRSGA